MLALTSLTMNRTPTMEELHVSEDPRAELLALFDGGPETGFALRFEGERDPESEGSAMAELLASLAMHDADFRAARTLMVPPPDAASLARGLAVLGHEDVRRELLDNALTTFGRKLVEPIAALLSTGESQAEKRLSLFRDIVVAQARELRMTHATTQMLVEDLRRMLDDEYLRALSECEEKVQRPRVQKLAQDALRAVGKTFHRALERWPDHAEQLAFAIASRMTEPLPWKDSPAIVRGHVVSAIEEFLWLGTSTELSTELTNLLAEHADVIGAKNVTLDRRLYRDFAEVCWQSIAAAC